MNYLSNDKGVADIINKELLRQRNQIELIASENFTSLAVMQATGSVLTNKYAEGYPERRYYGGCEIVDMAENLAIARVKKMFGCEYANVQPHSGSQANMAVYFALLQPYDKILGMSLSSGGHLTHGAKPTFSGKWLDAISYEVDPNTYLIDYDQVASLALQHKPKLIIAGSSSYSRIIDFKRFREIADSVGAYLMADVAHYAGLIVSGLYPNPFPYAHVVTSTTHKTLRGPRGAVILSNDEELSKRINSAVFPGIQGGPLMNTILAKAVAFGEALTSEYKQYMANVLENARILANTLMDCGINIISGGTDCHIVVADLRNIDITGKMAEVLLEKAGIACNKNGIPFDPLSPSVTSGLRFGSAAGTTRGFKEHEFEKIANMIANILLNVVKGDVDKIIADVAIEVKKLCQEFPLYPDLDPLVSPELGYRTQ